MTCAALIRRCASIRSRIGCFQDAATALRPTRSAEPQRMSDSCLSRGNPLPSGEKVQRDFAQVCTLVPHIVTAAELEYAIKTLVAPVSRRTRTVLFQIGGWRRVEDPQKSRRVADHSGAISGRQRLNPRGGGPAPALHLKKKIFGCIPSDAGIRNGYTIL